ncbi:MAG: hypothetical protein M3Z96_03405 [Pseudomonadota bacterium]|nr:hypothetical protein [Pseudomonadota bacterium]
MTKAEDLMPKIRTLATLAAIFVRTGPAFAASSKADWDKWETGIRDGLAIKLDGIEKLIGYRDAACDPEKIDPAHVPACKVAYDTIIGRRRAELAFLELMIKAAALSPADRDKLLESVAPYREYAKFKSRTTAKFAEVWKMFPAPAPE